MTRALVLLNVEAVVHEFYYCSFVSIDVAIVWSWKNCDDRWKILSSIPSMHPIALQFCFMSSNHWQQAILWEEGIGRILSENKGTASVGIGFESILKSPVLFIDRVRPYNVTKETFSRQLLKTVKSLKILYCFELWWYTAMHRNKLIVHYACYREGIEGFHEEVVSF